jgi:hypothetical protein
MSRLHQGLLLVAGTLLAWLLMQVVHELGHVLAAWATGGTVTKVVLHPLAISRTDVDPNPRPLVVVWGGPILGIAVPLLMWGAAAVTLPGAWAARFFAGFCLLANGLYLGVGSFEGIGDAGDLIRHGAPRWSLWLFGFVTVPAGLALWNGLGKYTGIGRNAQPVGSALAVGCVAALAAVALIEVALSPRF